jgi:hypothetical protein
VGVGTSIHCRILGFRETWETEKKLLLVGCLHLLLTHFLLLIGWSQKLIHVWALHDSSMFKVWYLEFFGGEGNTFNTTFGCENIACRAFSSEPLEMQLHPLMYSPRCPYSTIWSINYKIDKGWLLVQLLGVKELLLLSHQCRLLSFTCAQTLP